MIHFLFSQFLILKNKIHLFYQQTHFQVKLQTYYLVLNAYLEIPFYIHHMFTPL